MPVLVRYCNKCGIRISPLDLETGRAVEHKGGYYCAKCAEQLVVVAEVVEEEKPPEQKKAPAAVRKRAVHVNRERIPVRHAPKERSRHEEPLRDIRQPSGSQLPLYLLIAGVFVMLVVIIVIISQKEQPRRQPDRPSTPSTPVVELPPETGKKTGADVDAEAQRRLRARFDAIVKRAGDDPGELKVVIAELKAFLRKSGLSVSLVNEAKSRLDAYSRKLDNLVSAELLKVFGRVAALLKEFKFEEAHKALDEFPDTLSDENAIRELDREKQRIEFERAAHETCLELVKEVRPASAGESLETLRQKRDKLAKWLKRFPGTPHEEELKEDLGSIKGWIQKQERERRQKIQNEFTELKKRAGELAQNQKYSEAAQLLTQFASRYPAEKDMAGEALDMAAEYESLAEKAAAAPAPKPKEPRFRLDFTGSSVVSTMKKHKQEAATLRSADDDDRCLSMPAPEASVLRMEFDVEEVPDRLILALEHAGPKPPPGKKWKVLVNIKLNGKFVAENYEVDKAFRLDPFNIAKFVKKGANTLEIAPSKKTEAAYLLKRVGIARVLEDAFTPLEEEKPEPAGGDTEPVATAGDTLFDTKSLKDWGTNGPGKWEVEDGVIVGKHTGAGDDVGFIFPAKGDSKKWLDYKLSFRVWCNVAGGWQVALRAREATGGLVSGNLLNASEGFGANKWWKIVLRLDGEDIYASVDGSPEFQQGKDPDLLPGTFAFGVKLGAIVKFKDIEFELVKTK